MKVKITQSQQPANFIPNYTLMLQSLLLKQDLSQSATTTLGFPTVTLAWTRSTRTARTLSSIGLNRRPKPKNSTRNFEKFNWSHAEQFWSWHTLQGINISPKNGILKMIFLFPRWDMLVPWTSRSANFFHDFHSHTWLTGVMSKESIPASEKSPSMWRAEDF